MEVFRIGSSIATRNTRSKLQPPASYGRLMLMESFFALWLVP